MNGPLTWFGLIVRFMPEVAIQTVSAGGPAGGGQMMLARE